MQYSLGAALLQWTGTRHLKTISIFGVKERMTLLPNILGKTFTSPQRHRNLLSSRSFFQANKLLGWRWCDSIRWSGLTHLARLPRICYPWCHLAYLFSPLLPSLLTQLNYCSTAFARAGLCFRGILSLLFSHAVAEVLNHELRTAEDKFASKFQELSTNPLKPSKWLVTQAAVSSPPVPTHPRPLQPCLRPVPKVHLIYHHILLHRTLLWPNIQTRYSGYWIIFDFLRLQIFPHTLVRVLGDDILAKGGEAVIKYVISGFLWKQ